MNYIAFTDNAARQVIDSTTIFDEFVRVKAQAQPYAGGMLRAAFTFVVSEALLAEYCAALVSVSGVMLAIAVLPLPVATVCNMEPSAGLVI